MASTFSMLTVGSARFDRFKYKRDFDLFSGTSLKHSKGKSKEVALPVPTSVLPNSLDILGTRSAHGHQQTASSKRKRAAEVEVESESDASSSSSPSRSVPQQQKITLTGPSPLPTSLHSNLPSLLNHEFAPTSSRGGAPLLSAIQASGIHSLWGVQCSVGGCLLDGRDTMCVAPTGSGKTLAYALPIIVKLADPARSLRGKIEGKGVRAVVLVPTQDLAVQIHSVLRAVTRGRAWRCLVLTKATERAVCESSPGLNASTHAADNEDNESGGDDEDGAFDEDGDEIEDENEGFVDQNSSMERGLSGDRRPPLGIDVLIATPERMHHLIEGQRLSLASTRYLVSDESDRLLSADFLPQVEPIIAACSLPQIQKCFLSATMPAGAEEIARRWLRDDAVRVVVGVKDSAVTTVSQSLLYTGSESGKILALRDLVTSGNLPYPSLIFVQSVARADELYKTLVMDGMRVDVVHGNKSKGKRDEAVKAFREGTVWMLVVTEVLARGMDFRGVKVVINYDFPQTVQSYIHRIGRTGRAGRPGRAITFFSNEDGPYLRTIANVLRASGCPVPQYTLDLPKPSKTMKRRVARVPVERKEVSGGGRDVGREMGRRRREMVEGSKRRKGAGRVNGHAMRDGILPLEGGGVDMDE